MSIIFSSTSLDTTEDDLENSFFNLARSTGFTIVLNRILEAQSQKCATFSISIVDDIADGNGAKIQYFPTSANIIILIEKDAFDGDFYYYNDGQSSNYMSLERYLAEEVFHAYQFISGSSLSESDQEKDAQSFANQLMLELYGSDLEPPADIPEDPIGNPNTPIPVPGFRQLLEIIPHMLQAF